MTLPVTHWQRVHLFRLSSKPGLTLVLGIVLRVPATMNGEETVVLSLPGVSGLLLSGHLRSVPRHSPSVELHREPVAEGPEQVELSDNDGEDPDRLAPFVTQSEHPNVLSSLPDGGGVPRPRNLLSGLDFPVTVEDLAHERADFRHENVNWGAG